MHIYFRWSCTRRQYDEMKWTPTWHDVPCRQCTRSARVLSAGSVWQFSSMQCQHSREETAAEVTSTPAMKHHESKTRLTLTEERHEGEKDHAVIHRGASWITSSAWLVCEQQDNEKMNHRDKRCCTTLMLHHSNDSSFYFQQVFLHQLFMHSTCSLHFFTCYWIVGLRLR
jgi:hypothetical protein